MAEDIQAAQSYAKAVHELCDGAAQAAAWSETLGFLANVAANAEMVEYLADDSRTHDERAAGFLAVVQPELKGANAAQATNFVRLLGENARLALSPAIAEQFEKLREQTEKRITAHVVSAQPLSESEAVNIKSALSKRLNRDVELETEIDESLIGGAIVHAGDLVIDGSMRGGIAKMAGELSR